MNSRVDFGGCGLKVNALNHVIAFHFPLQIKDKTITFHSPLPFTSKSNTMSLKLKSLLLLLLFLIFVLPFSSGTSFFFYFSSRFVISIILMNYQHFMLL